MSNNSDLKKLKNIDGQATVREFISHLARMIARKHLKEVSGQKLSETPKNAADNGKI